MNDKTGSVILNETDSPLCRFFHESVLGSLVLVECKSEIRGSIQRGTGIVIGQIGNTQDGFGPIVMTAGHVIANLADKSEIRLTRFRRDPAGKVERKSAVFWHGGNMPGRPTSIFYKGPNSEFVDTGFIRGPAVFEDGDSFFDLDSSGTPLTGQCAPIETDWWVASEGTRVAWAGFPASVTALLGVPTPCYFEGVVAAGVFDANRGVYLLDGHNSLGVSGGPIWALDGQSRVRVIGSISAYHKPAVSADDLQLDQEAKSLHQLNSKLLPGFVIGAPIQPLISYLKNTWGKHAGSIDL